MPEWWKETMPDKGIVLGLDLQGGLHLVFEVEGDKAVEITTERYTSRLKSLLATKKLNAKVSANGLNITVNPSNDAIKNIISEDFPSLALIESQNGLVYKISDKEARWIKENATDQALETIRNRIDQFGVAEPTIVRP